MVHGVARRKAFRSGAVDGAGRLVGRLQPREVPPEPRHQEALALFAAGHEESGWAVSYTHLTLPTICSV
eukprot:7964651-Alexandrium_andersonii.AAC.1